MYDPVVVDTFIAIHSTLAQQMTASSVESSISDLRSVAVETESVSGSQTTPRPAAVASLDEIVASTEETLVLYDLAIGLTGHLELIGDVGDVIAKHLRRIVPASAVAFYIYDVNTDDLVSAHAVGTHVSNLLGLRIPRGERLSVGSRPTSKPL